MLHGTPSHVPHALYRLSLCGKTSRRSAVWSRSCTRSASSTSCAVRRTDLKLKLSGSSSSCGSPSGCVCTYRLCHTRHRWCCSRGPTVAAVCCHSSRGSSCIPCCQATLAVGRRAGLAYDSVGVAACVFSAKPLCKSQRLRVCVCGQRQASSRCAASVFVLCVCLSFIACIGLCTHTHTRIYTLIIL
jgi:hypothetical protein